MPRQWESFFEAFLQPSSSQLSLLSSTRTFLLEGKDGLTLGARQMQKNAYLRSRQGKKFASAGIRPRSTYGFGNTWYKVTVDELIAWRSWNGLKSLVPGIWTGSKGMF
jgi:hypothetical protein